MATGKNTSAITFTDGNGSSVQVNVTAYKPNSSITLDSMTTNPSNLDADGTSTSTITATFTGGAGKSVTFFTNLGQVGGASSVTVTADGSGVATTAYTASSVSGIATIKAVMEGVMGSAAINLNTVTFTNAETEILDAGTTSVDKKTTTGLSLDKSGSGAPSVVLATYSDNPGNGMNANKAGDYFDAHLDNTEDLETVTVKKWVTEAELAGMSASTLGLYYADGMEWKACSNSGYLSSPGGGYVGFVYATFTSTTEPSIEYLDGLPLVAAGAEVVTTTIPALPGWTMVLLMVVLAGAGFRVHRSGFKVKRLKGVSVPTVPAA